MKFGSSPLADIKFWTGALLGILGGLFAVLTLCDWLFASQPIVGNFLFSNGYHILLVFMVLPVVQSIIGGLVLGGIAASDQAYLAFGVSILAFDFFLALAVFRSVGVLLLVPILPFYAALVGISVFGGCLASQFWSKKTNGFRSRG